MNPLPRLYSTIKFTQHCVIYCRLLTPAHSYAHTLNIMIPVFSYSSITYHCKTGLQCVDTTDGDRTVLKSIHASIEIVARLVSILTIYSCYISFFPLLSRSTDNKEDVHDVISQILFHFFIFVHKEKRLKPQSLP